MAELSTRIVMAPWARWLLCEPARYKVAYGGRGSGKSWQIARALELLAMQRKLRILCAREFQMSIGESVHQLLSEQIHMCGLKGWDVGKTSITYANGSEFLFTGLWQNVDKIQSMEGIDYCWVEEAQRVSDNSWKVLIPTIRKPGSEIWVSFNPQEETDPTAVRFLQNTPPRTILLKVNWQSNPWLPAELKAEADWLKQTDPEQYEHVWEGAFWSRSDAQVYAGKWTVEAFEPGDDWEGPFDGIDFGFSTTPMVVGRQWLYDSTLFVEYAEGGLRIGNDEIPAYVDRIPRGRESTWRCDSARPETIMGLRKAGIDATPAEKWAGSVEDGVSFIRALKRIVIHPRAKLAEQCCRGYKHEVDRAGNILRHMVKKNDDWSDQARYALEPVIKREESAPKGLHFAFPS